MDPTHFLSSQAFQHHKADKTNPAEIEAFYDTHGSNFFAALPRWHARLSRAWRWLHNHNDGPTGFAPETQGS